MTLHNRYLQEAWYDLFQPESSSYYFLYHGNAHLVRTFTQLEHFYARSLCGRRSEQGILAALSPQQPLCRQCQRLFHFWKTASPGRAIPGLAALTRHPEYAPSRKV